MSTPEPAQQPASRHRFSTVGFKARRADLHRQSRYLFVGALAVSVMVTLLILRWPIPSADIERPHEQTPVVILVESVPEVTHRIETPAPPAPFSPSAEPIPVDDFQLDDVTIEDTVDTFDEPSSAPMVAEVPGEMRAEEIEGEIFEYFSVEEPPERKSSVLPVYPPLAARAGIGGVVTLKVLVTAEGQVDSVAVVDGPDILRESAVEAAEATTFTPARHNDRSVACWVILPFVFRVPE